MAASGIRDDGDFKRQTAHLAFTPDFNTRLEAIMHDRLATIGERYMAWLARNCWGRSSWYAVKEDGTPAWQRDAVEDLSISKQRISAATRYLVQRGYLREELKILYLVISPQPGPDPQKVRYTPDFLTNFLSDWKVTNTQDFLEWEQARETRKVANTTVKKIERIMAADYKKWQGARTLPQKSAEAAHSEPRLKSVGTYLPTYIEEGRYVGAAEPGLSDQKPQDSIEKEILALPAVQQVQKRLHSLPSPELLGKIVENLQGAPPERFNARIEQRFNAVKTFGFLQNLALDVGNAYREESDRSAAPAAESQTLQRLKIEAWKAILADPNESLEIKEETRRHLEVELNNKKRKIDEPTVSDKP